MIKKQKSKKHQKSFIFSMKIFFRIFFENPKKSKFFEFRKKHHFSINFFRSIFSQEISKFSEIFRFFQIFRKNFFIEKFEFFLIFFFIFVFLSYLMPSLCKWHRATPPGLPVGAANATSKIRKITKKWCKLLDPSGHGPLLN